MGKDFGFGVFIEKYASLIGNEKDVREYFEKNILPNLGYYVGAIKKPYGELDEDEKVIRDFYLANVLPVIKQIAQNTDAVSGKVGQIPEIYKYFFEKIKENFPEYIGKFSSFAIPSPA
jgi:hypothetical protein